MSTEEIEYRGHILVVKPDGPGWQIRIYPDHTTITHVGYPKTLSHSSKQDIIEEAKRLVDALVP
jgi:hypothetical protein